LLTLLQLALAYETLKDEDNRRAYNRIYPSIFRGQANPQKTQTPRPPPAPTSQPEASSDEAQIAALRKENEELGSRWRVRRESLYSPISTLQESIRVLKREIKNLVSVADAEAAVEARKNSWATWAFSGLSKKVDEGEDEKARKDRQRQERKIEIDLKERRLSSQEAQLQEKEKTLKQAQAAFNAANLANATRIQIIETRRRDRRAREQKEKERVEQERLEKIQKERAEQAAKEANEAARKRQVETQKASAAAWKQRAEARKAQEAAWKQQAEVHKAREASRIAQMEAQAAESAQREEQARLQRRRQNHSHVNHGYCSTHHTQHASVCDHDGWWDKVHGRAPCPECQDVWNYLLQCPSCDIEACPKCQRDLRPRFPRNMPRR
jgi:hypothetical protein